MISLGEVIETNTMIEKENLDVRTITLGINLLDTISDDIDKTVSGIYEKITRVAKDLIKVGNEIETEYAIPIINKRISVTPISLVAASSAKSIDDYVRIAIALDKAAKEVGVNFLGGFSALPAKGTTKSEELLMRSLPFALKETDNVCASVNLASTKTGINMDLFSIIL